MTYATAMRDFGVDKPDTRFDMRIQGARLRMAIDAHDLPEVEAEPPTLSIGTSHSVTPKTWRACVASLSGRPYTCDALLVRHDDDGNVESIVGDDSGDRVRLALRGQSSPANTTTIVMTGETEELVRKYAGQMRLTLANELERKGACVLRSLDSTLRRHRRARGDVQPLLGGRLPALRVHRRRGREDHLRECPSPLH